MASPSVTDLLPGLPGRRRRRDAMALMLSLAAVLWLHGLLIGALMPAQALRAGQAARQWPAAPALHVRTLMLPAPTAPARQPATVAARPARPATVATPPADPAVGPAADPRANSAVAAIGGAPAMAAAASEAQAAAPTEGEPPPVYPTRLPAPAQLRYALRHNGVAGLATLVWRHDGDHYTLQLDGRSATQALVEQTSEGGFDAAGLAPMRYADRRRGRSWQAAHFQRDIGRITFSGPPNDHPAWPGAQDRLSWLVQLAAINAAAASPLPQVTLFVADARGAGTLWRLVAQVDELLDTPLGPLPAQRWLREPTRPEGLRVEVWLSAALGHWPLLLRYTVPRSGNVFELRLLAEPAPP